MNSVRDHYRQVLGNRYSSMLGEFDAAVGREVDALRGIGIQASDGAAALDLGCGSGLHSIALARMGFEVRSVDFAPELLDELEARAQGLAVTTLEADLRDPRAFTGGPFELIVCMGDTLAHLQSMDEIRGLIENCRQALRPAGRIVLGFRDQTQKLEGSDRIIPVVLEKDRIWTCFLEFAADRIHVHDVFHERTPHGTWRMHKGSYEKLRLRGDQVAELGEALGFSAELHPRGHGMVALLLARQ